MDFGGNISGSGVSPNSEMPEMLGGCCVCSDEEGWADNSLVYCDGEGCSVAVHQACYGILRVPEGDWYCRRCEAIRNGKNAKLDIRCELCHNQDGALKPTESGKWCHVLCALYIPEATFGDVQAMEPIILRNVQRERFGRLCSICNGSQGACTQCSCSSATNSSSQGRAGTSCTISFHVTCAQSRGLLCELQIGGTTRYPAYCEEHMKTLKPGIKLKRLPPYKGPPTAPGNSPPSSPPALRPRRNATVVGSNGSLRSPTPPQGESLSDQPSSRATRSGSVSSPHSQEGLLSASASGSNNLGESRAPSAQDATEKHKKNKLLSKRRAELSNGQSPVEKSISSTSKSLSSIEKKSRGRQKGSKKHASPELLGETKEYASSNGNNGIVFYGKLSEEAAIRVRHASAKDSKQANNPDGHVPPAGSKESATSSAGNDLWSLFSQKKLHLENGTSLSGGILHTTEPNSVEGLLDDKFWQESGMRFLLSEVQQTAPADIVELLHALYQIELENQQLEAKIASISSALEDQKVKAGRLAVPLTAQLSQFQTPSSNQPSSSSGNVIGAPVTTAAVQHTQMQHQIGPFHFPFIMPGHASSNGMTPTPQGASATFQLKGSAPGPSINPSKQMPANFSSPFTLPNTGDISAMQYQLYQQLYQQQFQHQMQNSGSSSVPTAQQQKTDVTSAYGNQISMTTPLLPPSQQPSAASVLSSLSAISAQQQQQQRSLPLKLVEPAPTIAVSGSMMSSSSSVTTLPPDGMLVPPPPPLLSAPTAPATSPSVNSNPRPAKTAVSVTTDNNASQQNKAAEQS